MTDSIEDVMSKYEERYDEARQKRIEARKAPHALKPKETRKLKAGYDAWLKRLKTNDGS